jgi:Transposase, Mutator family
MTTGVGSFKSYQLSEGRTTPVPNRVSPTDRIRAEIDALFDGSRELGEVIEDVARLGARLIIQTAVEAEVEVFLGRARYQRSAAAADARPGMGNGYCAATVKTTAGPVTVARPKLRGTTERFASALFGKSVTRSNALEALVIAGFVRGLSVRDVENTLADALGAEAALSKSAVSRICQAIGDEFTAWSGRRLDGLELDYLFLDASMFKMHPGARAEPVLAAWGTGTDGKPVFVALAAGGSESTDAWASFLNELRGRGLRPPLLVISDGAAGLISATESVLARSLRQKCLIHRSRKELTCRCVARWCCSEKLGHCAVAGRRLVRDVSFLLEERPGLADDIADCGPADVAEGAGEDVQGAQSSLVEDGQQDAFTVADLLVEDAAAGAGLARAAAALIGEAFGLGCLPRCEPFGEFA